MIRVRWALGLIVLGVFGCRTADPPPLDAAPPIASTPTASSADTTSAPSDDAPTSTPTSTPSVERLPTPTYDLSPFRGAHVYAGLPRPSPGAEYTLLENIGFLVGYSEAREDPLWVAYRLDGVAAHVPGKRPRGFKVDPRTQARVAHDDYKQPDYQQDPDAYDRGHMAPNYAIASRYGREAQLETFYMSNIVPQRKALNQQTWAALEKAIADEWAAECGEVWVVVGPIFGDSPARLNGRSEVPDAFYALVLDEDPPALRALALILSQEVRGRPPLRPFVTTIDAVEAATALDFFADLPDDLEAALEGAEADARWGLDRPAAPARR